ncbi:hypothetical protein KSS87_010511, partial [Heliosperma pusillum]
IGLGLTGFGVFFTFLGVVFLFDKGLLAMGNVGVQMSLSLVNLEQGTISFGVGFFFVLIGWPILGMILESYGFLVLFSGFWPTLAVFVQRIPVLGWILQHPFFRSPPNTSDTATITDAPPTVAGAGEAPVPTAWSFRQLQGGGVVIVCGEFALLVVVVVVVISVMAVTLVDGS